ncbi:hypothetical protein [Croceicoccus sp. BE223]|uniref:hypothetical protein n=1 Tax=Croceicoccus sp. BE223 TaxID=2817716 RepID=UPI002863C5A2|nr:hypothetical protein [Croceicoccus sp. BE223]MDR7101439.1 hypothetical protein [Croceicoccus sp. BE223]
MTGILNFSPALAEVFAERMRQIDQFGHSPDADFDAYWNADDGRTRLAAIGARFADGARDHISVGSLKAARAYALRAAATNLALIELIDRVTDHTATATDLGDAA